MNIKRTLIEKLQKWLFSKDRKPMLLRGARQVGKTWLVRQLAKENDLVLIECNFEKKPELATLFESNEPKVILSHLESTYNQSIDPRTSLLFLDEIQASPDLLSKLRWFAEEMPELAVVAAGSLLEFVLAEHEFSMPVGRINYGYVEPLSFQEFLQAHDQTKLIDFIKNFSLKEKIPLALHEKLSEFFMEYMRVGGLPAAVSNFAEQHSFIEVEQIHHDLLSSYRDDFAKYAGKISLSRLDELLNKLPFFLGKKFIYQHVNKEISTAAIKQALQLLIKAKLCSPIYCTSANGVPLAAEIREREFKMAFLDVGLANTALGLKIRTPLELINQGAISEQVVAQLLRTTNPFYVEPALYYWAREEKGSAAELDYVVAHEGKIIPIEVKAGSTGSLKSLHVFMGLKKRELAIRINTA
jgi:predicted AAA+ superfamily ATPase